MMVPETAFGRHPCRGAGTCLRAIGPLVCRLTTSNAESKLCPV